MSYLLEIVGRGLLAELAAAFRTSLADSEEIPTDGLVRLARQFPDNPAHRARLGIRALRDGRAADAARFFREVLDLDPDNVDALLGLACSLDECGDLKSATEQIRLARSRQPENAAITFALGFCLEKAGAADEALTAYAEALEQAPQLRNAHERLAAICLLRDDLDGAIEHYEQLCWFEPGDIDMQLTLANLCMKAGRADEAIHRYQFALTIDPDNWDAKGDLVDAYEDAGEYEQAIEHLEQLATEQPEFADHHLRLGDMYARVGRMCEAQVKYEDAIAANPDYLEAHIKLGTIYLRDGDYLEAARAFNQAVELNDRLLTAYVGLGVAQFEAGQIDAADDTLKMAANVEPNSTVLFGEMARLQLKASINDQVDKYVGGLAVETTMERGDQAPAGDLIDEQIQRHEDAIARHPNYADLHYRLGMLLRHRGRTEEAVAAFHQALLINPNYLKAMIKLGMAYKDKGEHETAVDTFRRALKVDDSTVELYYQLGLIFADRGQFALAVENFEHAVRRDPTNVEFRANLALALQDMGLVDRATSAWRTLSEIAPETPRGRDVLMRISGRD